MAVNDQNQYCPP